VDITKLESQREGIEDLLDTEIAMAYRRAYEAMRELMLSITNDLKGSVWK
jgi:hypothetical protein